MASALLLLPALVLAQLTNVLGDLAVAVAHPAPGYKHEFEAWRRRYHKSYASPQEEEAHFKAFKRNFDTVKAMNAKGGSFKLELNAFADLIPEEFAQSRGMPLTLRSSMFDGLPNLGTHRHRNVSLPSSVDWRDHGAVTAVKNQGQCGACWAFTTTGSIEGAWSIATNGKQLLQLSEQQLVDCDPGENGCGGGLPERAFYYLGKTPAHLCSEGSYSYNAVRGTCKVDSCVEAIPEGGIIGFKEVTADDTQALMDAVAQQPTTASIDGDDAFQLYKNGVLSVPCGNKISHSVLLVGYGREGSQDYWLVKNSWGPDWGENGYARILRGKAGAGECGIKSDSAYPVVDGGKANPNMNKFPLGTIMFGAVAGIALLFLLPWGCRRMCQCIQKRRGQDGARGPLTASSTSLQRPVQVTPIVPASEAAQLPAIDPSVRKGNSRASRLLGGS